MNHQVLLTGPYPAEAVPGPPGPGPGPGRSFGFRPRLLPTWPRRGSGHIGLAEHLYHYGPLPVIGAGIEQRVGFGVVLERSGLVGRGGAGFPTARKMQAIDATKAEPVVVANGTEGEPASQKDKVLLSLSPHLVLDGAALAARAVGAREVWVVVNPAVVATVRAAASERGPAANNNVRLRVVEGRDRFVAGEASALANFLESGTAKPRPAPTRLVERGAWGRPTLVNNVETLAHLALIARHGPSWFRSVGTADEPGSMLVTVLGAVRRPVVAEVELGVSVAGVLAQAGGPTGALQALLLGGYFGTFVPAPEAVGRPYSRAGLAPLGADIGAGVVVAISAQTCGLKELARVAGYLAGESAGQCGPCVFGLGAIADELDTLAHRPRAGAEARLQRWASQVDGRGACHLPDGAVHMVASALRVFGGEIEAHRSGHCRASDPRPVLPVPRAAL